MNLVKIVTGVEVIEASSLEGMNKVRKGVVALPSNISWVPVSILVPAKLTIINKVDDKNTVWTSTLQFRTCEDCSDRKHACYRVHLSDGRKLLIGSSERPYPVTVVNESMPDNVNDSQLQEVTVTLTSRNKPPQIA
jgi:hypothetical protein